MDDRFKFIAYWYNNVFNEWMVYENPELITGDGTCRVFDNGESGADEWRENAILCQCTGLKDKNGKLIYEGDIVKFNFDTDEIRAVVSWDDKELIGFYLNTTDYFKDKYVTDYDFYKNDYEVIGNIYENKELLEEES